MHKLGGVEMVEPARGLPRHSCADPTRRVHIRMRRHLRRAGLCAREARVASPTKTIPICENRGGAEARPERAHHHELSDEQEVIVALRGAEEERDVRVPNSREHGHLRVEMRTLA